MTFQVQERQFWLSYFWSYIPFFFFNLISCSFCNTNALWNILMLFGRNVEQDKMKCYVQERQLWLSYLWSYLPFLCLNLILCPFCNSNTFWIILILLGRNVEQDDDMLRTE